MTLFQEALGGWLGTFSWTHATTLTFRNPCGAPATVRACRRHLRDLDRRAHCRVSAFWVIELTHAGHHHLHTLIDAPLTSAVVRRSWEPGWAKVQAYDSRRGWRYYITKAIGEAAVDWDIR